MEKSIEKIWKDAFLNEGELKVPAINNFYERKSMLVVDKLISRLGIEFKILFPLALMVFIINLVMGNGLVWSTLGVAPFVPWFFIAHAQIKSMKSVPANSNCLEYLLNVKTELKRIFRYNFRATIVLIFLTSFPTFLYTYIKQKGKTLGEIFGIDNFDANALWIFAAIPIALILAAILFKATHKLTNKNELNLYALIDDLKTLKKNNL